MFEHFTFGAMPQSRDALQDEAFLSPIDTSFPSPLTPPPTSFPFPSNPNQAGLNDIVMKFSQQTIQPKSRDELVQQFQAWQNDHDLEIDDEEMESPSERIAETASLPPTPILSSTRTVTCRRLQRQLNVQLQTCSSHIRDINTLVEDMIVSNSQCTLRKATSRTHLLSPPPSRGRDVVEMLVVDTSEYDDEGFYEDEGFAEEETEMSLRRASTPSGIRKYNGVRYGRSADIVNIGGKLKVRSFPRMRKRKVQVARVPE